MREGSHELKGAPAPGILSGHGYAVNQRPGGAGKDGYLRAVQQVEDVDHVLGPLIGPDIAADHSDAGYHDLLRAAHEHDECCAIVAKEAGIGIEEDGFASGAPC